MIRLADVLGRALDGLVRIVAALAGMLWTLSRWLRRRDVRQAPLAWTGRLRLWGAGMLAAFRQRVS